MLVYILILHETDVYALYQQKQKVRELRAEIITRQAEIDDLKLALNDLDNPRSLEKYAREYHFFKKEDEDLFILSFE